ncbi:MAG: hypothetical protein AAGK78_14950, partial [Planctomycetota bacterium]
RDWIETRPRHDLVYGPDVPGGPDVAFPRLASTYALIADVSFPQADLVVRAEFGRQSSPEEPNTVSLFGVIVPLDLVPIMAPLVSLALSTYLLLQFEAVRVHRPSPRLLRRFAWPPLFSWKHAVIVLGSTMLVLPMIPVITYRLRLDLSGADLWMAEVAVLGHAVPFFGLYLKAAWLHLNGQRVRSGLASPSTASDTAQSSGSS